MRALRRLVLGSLIIGTTLLGACGGGGTDAGAGLANGQGASVPPTAVPPTLKSGGLVSPAQFGLFPLQTVSGASAGCLHSSTSGIEGTGLRQLRGVVRAVSSDSLTVDEVQFAAGNAQVFVNGYCATLADVHVGDTVTVVGEIDTSTDTGTAVSIYAEANLVGAVLAVDAANGILNVIGQDVQVTAQTVFADDIRPPSLASLQPYQSVALMYTVAADGSVVASRIERGAGGGDWWAMGIVTAVDPGNGLLRIGNLRVRFADATLVDFNAPVQVGDRIRAYGAPLWVTPGYPCCDPADGGITAALVQRLAPEASPTQIALAGLITAAEAPNDFYVMGQRVLVPPNLPDAQPYDATGWYPGTYATVFGRRDSSGTVVADFLRVAGGMDLLMVAPITAVDPVNRSVQAGGYTLEVSSNTFIERLHGSYAEAISIDGLSVGDSIAVEGLHIDEQHVAAVLLRETGPSDQFYIWGGVTGHHEPMLVLSSGVQVDTSQSQFFSGHSMPQRCSCGGSSAAAFWDRSSKRFAFTSIEVFGRWSNGNVVAEQILWDEE